MCSGQRTEAGGRPRRTHGRRRTRPRALYSRPPLHCVNTIRSLRLDLDYLESTCNAHIRSGSRDVSAVTMAGTCRPGLGRDTLKERLGS
ncbi:hypothetical protein EVAR_18857_1 [Eumeta japonica]|uniref:Uncharacterized protein n=1 Tax=Eumeta variegata TaxID=151549 RepID=A0A4C1UMH5_EUMVA|nr:hypothetical protein EVAR_18857_1 [Eumeta japonica]